MADDEGDGDGEGGGTSASIDLDSVEPGGGTSASVELDSVELESVELESVELESGTATGTGAGRPPSNIVLTGFMGTGKSTVGRLLAGRLGLTFVDTDQLIERRHGPIPRIFDELGESGFRRIERAIAEELVHDTGYVISTGGRFMLDERNAELLSAGNRVFCLVAEFDVIYERVMRRRSSRPMLAGPNPRQRVEALLNERAAGYAKFEAVPTGVAPATKVVDDIVERLGR